MVVLLWCLHADLKEGVSDEGLVALAEAGCGRDLIVLSLTSECAFECCWKGCPVCLFSVQTCTRA